MDGSVETSNDAIDIDPTIIDRLDTLTHETREEITSTSYLLLPFPARYLLIPPSGIEARQKDLQTMIESQFSDLHHLPYRLQAVFVHRGSVAFGHYYIYIYDFEKDIWRKYNDEYVTEVQNRDEIFQHYGEQNPPTPYFLVYVNDGLKSRLVNPVCREIAEMDTRPDETMPAGGSTEATTDKPIEDTVMEDPPTYRESVVDPAGTNIHMTAADRGDSNNYGTTPHYASKQATGGESNESATDSFEKIQW